MIDLDGYNPVGREQVQAVVNEVTEAFFNPRSWREQDHPRDPNGKFAPPGSSGIIGRASRLAKLSRERKAARKEARSEKDEKKRRERRINILVNKQRLMEDLQLIRK